MCKRPASNGAAGAQVRWYDGSYHRPINWAVLMMIGPWCPTCDSVCFQRMYSVSLHYDDMIDI